jgi:hypothetical protein
MECRAGAAGAGASECMTNMGEAFTSINADAAGIMRAVITGALLDCYDDEARIISNTFR